MICFVCLCLFVRVRVSCVWFVCDLVCGVVWLVLFVFVVCVCVCLCVVR